MDPSHTDLTSDQGRLLLAIARSAIAEALGLGSFALPDEPWLQRPAATFVTLTADGALRGCLGSLQAFRSLHEDLCANATAAALRDPRFAPLDAAELPGIRLEVSVLSPLAPVVAADEAALLATLEPGRHGLLLEWGSHRGTFLPQMWEKLPEPRDFWRHLKAKAGLAPDFWSHEAAVWRYTVRSWHEDERG